MEIYSKRRKAAEQAGKPDVYSYGEFPKRLRIQIEHILAGLLGREFEPEDDLYGDRAHRSESIWKLVESILARELGFYTFSQVGGWARVRWPRFLHDARTENIFDLLEVAFRVGRWELEDGRRLPGVIEMPYAESEINRFIREAGFGYRLEGGAVIRVDSTFVHEEVVRPGLQFLMAPGFEGPAEEFLRAHEHYRHSRGKEALVAACAALESTCKVVLDRAGEGFDPKWNANKLIQAVFDQGLVDKSLESLFNALKTVLVSGVPTMRGKRGGHGQGAEIAPVPEYFVAYALHQLAAAIVFLVEAAKGSGKLSSDDGA